MKATDVWESDDVAVFFFLDWSRLWTVLIQGQMGSHSVIIDEIIGQCLPQMILTQNNDVIQDLTADRADMVLVSWKVDKKASRKASRLASKKVSQNGVGKKPLPC